MRVQPKNRMRENCTSGTARGVPGNRHSYRRGRTVAPGADSAHAVVEAADVASSGPRLAFHKVPEGKTVKNRVHFDLITADFDRELDRLVRLGATKLHEIDAGAHWVTLADPEGNEFDFIKG
jgi:hypothetical protein